MIFRTAIQLRLEQGDVAGAITDYTQALQLKPDLAQAYYQRALAHRDSGDTAAAQTDLTQAIAPFQTQNDRLQGKIGE